MVDKFGEKFPLGKNLSTILPVTLSLKQTISLYQGRVFQGRVGSKGTILLKLEIGHKARLISSFKSPQTTVNDVCNKKTVLVKNLFLYLSSLTLSSEYPPESGEAPLSGVPSSTGAKFYPLFFPLFFPSWGVMTSWPPGVWTLWPGSPEGIRGSGVPPPQGDRPGPTSWICAWAPKFWRQLCL